MFHDQTSPTFTLTAISYFLRFASNAISSLTSLPCSLLSSFLFVIWCCYPYCELKKLTISTHLFLPSPPSHLLTNELQGDHDQVLSAIVWNNSLFCEVKVRL